jgi:NhaB family Na+:H+ antiporter
MQGVSGILLIAALALHLAPVGFIGLALIIIQTAFMGITDEHRLGKAFEEALPFTGLLVVFFL